MKRPKCCFCSDPTLTPDDLSPFPTQLPPDQSERQQWACVGCLEATQAMDRQLRSHYIRKGLIKPADTLTGHKVVLP